MDRLKPWYFSGFFVPIGELTAMISPFEGRRGHNLVFRKEYNLLYNYRWCSFLLAKNYHNSETLKQNKTVHFRVAVCHYGLKTSLRETNEMKKINICMKMQNSIRFTLLWTKHLFHNEANSILGNSADICCRRGVELSYPSAFCVCKIYFSRESLRIFNCI